MSIRPCAVCGKDYKPGDRVYSVEEGVVDQNRGEEAGIRMAGFTLYPTLHKQCFLKTFPMSIELHEAAQKDQDFYRKEYKKKFQPTK